MKLASKLIGLAFAILVLTAVAPAARAEGDGVPTTPCSQDKSPGCVLTTLDGVNVYYNGMDPTADEGESDYGYLWQCVELIQRYYAVKFDYPKIWAPLYAYEMFDDWGHPDTMTAYPNGSSSAPREGDVLVFGPVWGNPYGHVALVKSVGNGQVTFVQQNVYDTGEDSLPIDSNNNISNESNYGPVRGWLRDTSRPRVIEEEIFAPATQVLVNFAVHANGNTQLLLDGKTVLSGGADQTTGWTLINAGRHTLQVVATGAVDARIGWTTRSIDDIHISN